MITFEKEYTRDFTLIMGELWLFSLDRLCVESGWGISPEPLYVGYRHNGVNEYWANPRGLQWFIDRIYGEHMKGRKYFEEKIKIYRDCVNELQQYWEKDACSVTELNTVFELALRACTGWCVMYYSAGDERTPHDIRAEAAATRDADVLGDKTDALVERSLRRLYPEFGDTVRQILEEEIANPPAMSELGKRNDSFILFQHGNEKVTENLLLADFVGHHSGWRLIRPADITGAREVRGSVGFKGAVQGKVRLLLRKKQIPELKEGEILVTHMTTPDFVPAMRRAAAVVTDEGGVTCHAAIIARELKKPCVIGTKIATQIFKDGDVVEVDAEKGIVRKV